MPPDMDRARDRHGVDRKSERAIGAPGQARWSYQREWEGSSMAVMQVSGEHNSQDAPSAEESGNAKVQRT